MSAALIKRALLMGKKPGVIKTVAITSGSTFTVPSDFSHLVAVHCIGPGGNGYAGTGAYDGGAGGGAWSESTAITGLVAGSTAFISIPSGGSQAATWFNAATGAAPTSSTHGCLADYGLNGTSQATPVSGGLAANFVGTASNSGGSSGNVTSGQDNGAGGGGAGGPHGPGANGGDNSSTAGPGGGGGGADGGGAGVNGNSNTYGQGGGTGGIDGGAGGNCGGSVSGNVGGTGSMAINWTQTSDSSTYGASGGGGGSSYYSGLVGSGGGGGIYGGGGGGGYNGYGVGGQGLIIFIYST